MLKRGSPLKGEIARWRRALLLLSFKSCVVLMKGAHGKEDIQAADQSESRRERGGALHRLFQPTHCKGVAFISMSQKQTINDFKIAQGQSTTQLKTAMLMCEALIFFPNENSRRDQPHLTPQNSLSHAGGGGSKLDGTSPTIERRSWLALPGSSKTRPVHFPHSFYKNIYNNYVKPRTKPSRIPVNHDHETF